MCRYVTESIFVNFNRQMFIFMNMIETVWNYFACELISGTTEVWTYVLLSVTFTQLAVSDYIMVRIVSLVISG